MTLVVYLGSFAAEAPEEVRPAISLCWTNPTTGMHRHDVNVLLSVLIRS